MPKRERKTNYSVDGYFKDAMRVGPSKQEKAPKLPRAPKQVQINDFQFFPPKLAELQERELAAFKKLNEIPATVREAGPDDSPEDLEKERQAAQEIIDNAESLTEEEQTEKEALIKQGFENWSKRDFQQFIRALVSYGWTEDFELLASEIPDKSASEVGEYYPIFKKKWKTLADHARIATRIQEGEAKRNKRSNLEALLGEKINSVVYPMQELELNYPSTKGKVYSEEEDRYLLCRLNHYGMQAEDVYERIKRDISEFPVFRFDWFFKSRSPQELARRCTTLLSMIEKEAEAEKVDGVKKGTTSRGKKRAIEEVQKEEKASVKPSRSSTPSTSTTAAGTRKRQKKT